jgi:hypothetical protein
MKRQDAEKKIGTRVSAWTSANGIYVGTLVAVISSAKWRGVVKIDGVITPAHHFEFGQVVRRGFRPGEEIEVGGVNITFDVPETTTGTTYLEALQADQVRLAELSAASVGSPHLWALEGSVKANQRILEAEQIRLATGEWKVNKDPLSK